MTQLRDAKVPPQEDLDRCRAGALDFANQVRAENKLKPLKKMPKAMDWDPRMPWTCRCPLAVALEELEPSVHRSYVRLYSEHSTDEMNTVDLPRDVAMFVRYVDNFMYPDLYRGLGNG